MPASTLSSSPATPTLSDFSGRIRSQMAGPSVFSFLGRPRPASFSKTLHSPSKIADAVKLRPEGFFEAVWPSDQQTAPEPGSYKIQCRTQHGDSLEIFDPYAFPFQLTDFDLHLMSEGRHYDTYEKLGAHLHTVRGIAGTNFAVWAPGARRVSVVGTMNGWDGRVHPMRPRGSSGIWELFLPEVGEGAIYKYEITGLHGNMLPLKADPTASAPNCAPTPVRS